METSHTAQQQKHSSAATEPPVADDVLFQAGEFIDAQSLLVEENEASTPGAWAPSASWMPRSADTAAVEAAAAPTATSPTQSSRGGPAASCRSAMAGMESRGSSLADMDSALASNLDSLLQSDFESVEQVLTEPAATTSAAERESDVSSRPSESGDSGGTAPDFVIHRGSPAETTQGGGMHVPPGAEGASDPGAHGESAEASFESVESVISIGGAGESTHAPSGGQSSGGAALAAMTEKAAGEGGGLTREALERPAGPANAPHAAEPAESRHNPAAPVATAAREVGPTSDSPKPADARRSLRARAARLAHPALQVLHLINRPLTMLPAKFHSAIDVISLSTLFWAAVVWGVVVLGPQRASVTGEAHVATTSHEAAAPVEAHAGTASAPHDAQQ